MGHLGLFRETFTFTLRPCVRRTAGSDGRKLKTGGHSSCTVACTSLYRIGYVFSFLCISSHLKLCMAVHTWKGATSSQVSVNTGEHKSMGCSPWRTSYPIFFSSRTDITATVPVHKTQIDVLFVAKRHIYKSLQSEVTVSFTISRTTAVVTIAFDACTHPLYSPPPVNSVIDKNRALL